MKITTTRLLMLILTQSSLLLYGNNISNDSLKNKTKTFSGVFVDIGGTSPWLSVNYQQIFFSKKLYSVGIMTGFNRKGGYSDNIFQNHWYLLNSINYEKASVEIGIGVKLSYLSEGYSVIVDEHNGIEYFSTNPNQIESDLIYQASFRYNISKRFYIKCSANGKISDLSPNYTSYFYNSHYGARKFLENYNFPLSISIIGFASNPSRKNVNCDLYERTKNAFFINFLNYSFGYERRILKKNEHSLYASYQNLFIPYKRYYESNKRGILYIPALSLNYCFSANQAFTPVIGFSYVHVYNKFSVFDKLFYEKADYLRANIGLKFSVYKNLFMKINYGPKVKVFNDHTTLNKDNSEINFDLIHESITDLYFTFGYAF
ncbi:MAG: hypothetical protein HPY79_12480 [Bacteroidales bacterium]|nr:hypothetical protein [Bacteroidales bacterium]